MSWSTRSGFALLFASCVAAHAGDSPTIESNFRYRLDFGDLGDPSGIVPGHTQSKRALPIRGGEQLLRVCEGDREHWQLDPVLFRFGHGHPFSTIGCRERTSPSMHVVFYKAPTGTREAWVHFDLYGPQNIPGHATEVMRNRMTFGRTSEYEVFRGLIRERPDAVEAVPPPQYDLAAHTKLYLNNAFGPHATAMAMATGAVDAAAHGVTGWGTGRYTDQLATNLVRHATAESIEFGMAAFLQQDQAIVRSHEKGFRRRSRAAFYHALFVPGRDGDEFAFPRLAAAFGTPWVLRDFHPGHAHACDPWAQSGVLLGSYLVRSFWTEFKPEITRTIHRALR